MGRKLFASGPFYACKPVIYICMTTPRSPGQISPGLNIPVNLLFPNFATPNLCSQILYQL